MSRRPEDDADAWLRFWLTFTVEIERGTNHGVAGLTGSAWRVLVHLGTRSDPGSPIDIDAISEACGLSTASTSRALAELEKVEYIRRRRSNVDGRLVERELTKAGRHALGRIIHAAHPPP